MNRLATPTVNPAKNPTHAGLRRNNPKRIPVSNRNRLLNSRSQRAPSA
ncbi:MAG: hypothetical protein WKF71_01880 [Pyrinomonadaceae bacterium]